MKDVKIYVHNKDILLNEVVYYFRIDDLDIDDEVKKLFKDIDYGIAITNCVEVEVIPFLIKTVSSFIEKEI